MVGWAVGPIEALPFYLGIANTCLRFMVQAGMGKKNQPQPDNTIKPPEKWKTGDEPMTGAQNSYLHTLADIAGEEVEDDLTKAEASKKIDELQEKTGRGE
jgi:hypothetical protein